MAEINVKESLLVGAPPDTVYRVLADPAHHARILPDAFVDYKPENDSVVSFSLKMGSVKRDFKMRTEQTEPNKLYREMDLNTNIITEFHLEPHTDGTVVTIVTNYQTDRSISGFIESFTAPIFLRQVYKEELVKLGRYVLLI
jgi:carbon monoxide dehydrogenase subunit G